MYYVNLDGVEKAHFVGRDDACSYAWRLMESGPYDPSSIDVISTFSADNYHQNWHSHCIHQRNKRYAENVEYLVASGWPRHLASR